MKKSDLKTGMVVETRNQGKYFVMINPDCKERELIDMKGTGFNCLSSYNDDLTFGQGPEEWDIVRVYSLENTIAFLFSEPKKMCYSLLWERPEEYIEMTISEIEKKLGIKNLVIIKEDK